MSKVAILIIAFILTTITSPLIGAHLCHLKASLIEIPLTVITTGLCILYIYKATGKAMHARRIFGTFLLSIIIYEGYGSWLHSESFPMSLLNDSSLYRHEQLLLMVEDRNISS